MRILYSDFDAFYPFNPAGSQRVGNQLLRLLAAEHGVECLALAPRQGRGIPSPAYHPRLAELHALGVRHLTVEEDRWVFDCGYPIVAVDRVADHLERFLDEFRPDVFYCHNPERGPELLRPAQERGIGCVWFFHDIRAAAEDVARAAAQGVEIVSCSRYMNRYYRDAIRALAAENGAAPNAGIEIEIEIGVVYPAIEARDYAVDADLENGFVTMINPVPEKGIETVLALLPLLPEERFLLVENWPLGAERLAALERRLASFPNARFLPHQADIREVYRQTRILIVPSVWSESAGRVVLEAQLNGIPVLASALGGLPEMVGEGGRVIEDYPNPQPWAEAIAALRDPVEHRRLSALARANAVRADFEPRAVARYFLDICRRAAAKSAPG
jgi:glycosyltransferase involved in cell wall biosynthesis